MEAHRARVVEHERGVLHLGQVGRAQVGQVDVHAGEAPKRDSVAMRERRVHSLFDARELEQREWVEVACHCGS